MKTNHKSQRNPKNAATIYRSDIAGVFILLLMVGNVAGFFYLYSLEDNLLSDGGLVGLGFYASFLICSLIFIGRYFKNLTIVGGENAGVTKRG